MLIVYRCPACPLTAATVALRDSPAVPLCQGEAHGRRVVEMTRVDGSEAVLVPMENVTASLVPAKVGSLHKAGILLPETQHALDWLYRHRETNGMADAFRKVGGRRCIDLVAFARLIRERRA